MELEIPSIQILLSSIFFLYLLFVITKKLTNKKKLPPGPWKLPIIGNIPQMMVPLPHHTLRDLAMKHGPLMHLQLGEVSTIIVSSPEIAKEIYKTHDITFSERPYVAATSALTYDAKDIAMAPYGKYWRQLRKIAVTELLSPKRVQSFRFIREEEASGFVKSIASHEGKTLNVTDKIFMLTYGVVSRAAFGNKSSHQEEYIDINKRVLKLASGFDIGDLFPSSKILQRIGGMQKKLKKLQVESDAILQNILDQHKDGRRNRTNTQGEVAEDLVDVLLNFQQDGDLEVPLTDDHVKAVIWDVFSAGSETSSTVVEWAMSELLRHPDLMKKAQSEVREVFGVKGKVEEAGLQELKFLKSVVKETLRLHPSGPLSFPRLSGEDCVINGYFIPAKTKVFVNLWAIGRDPKYWENAEQFQPERFLNSSIDFRGTDFEFIPFGAGRRICPGITFATPNIELPLANLLYHFDWKLPGEIRFEDLDMTETFGLTVKRKTDLFLIPIVYNP